MDQTTVINQLVDLLEKSLGRRPQVSSASKLVGDVGMESIQVIEYLCEVEDCFDLAITEDKLADVETLGDLAQVVIDMSNGN